MQQKRSQYSILAPAGSIEQLVAAVNNGCDAIYLGLDSFNARMKAPNFSRDNLAEWVNYCHMFGVKVFVAINTSIKNDEFLQAVELLLFAYKSNADGVIVTDLALMRIAGCLPKPFDVVASTQLNIHDRYGAEFVKKCGATTVVCARECSLADIRDIASTGVGVECFLHGAMCVCQSGQCLFSSMVGGNSGNRGLCAQPCRKYYKTEGDNITGGYLLSARDMCGLTDAKELAEAGATTFKIEGRNRRAEYAAVTSSVYSKLFCNNFEPQVGDYELLAEMFNRAMTSNYYLAARNDKIVYPVIQNHIGVIVGEIKRGGVYSTVPLNKGDGLKVFDNGLEICGGIVLEDGQGQVRAQFASKVRDGMIVHRTTSVKLCAEALSAKRKLDVSLSFVAKVGQKAEIAATCNGVNVRIKSDFTVQKARNKATNSEEIAKQLQKAGETHYTISDIINDSDDIFLSKAQLNELRRSVLASLTEKMIEAYNHQFEQRKSLELTGNDLILNLNSQINSFVLSDRHPYCAVICYNEEQLSFAQNQAKCLIYKPSDADLKAFETAYKYQAYVDLPPFADLNYVEKILNKVRGKLVCHNVGQVEFAREHNLQYIAGSGLNLFNDFIINEFADARTFVYSLELSLGEINSLKSNSGLIFVDGNIALMKLCHCPFKLVYKCDCSTCKANNGLIYKDELGNRFIIKRRRVGGKCSFELVNGKKMSVVARLKKSGKYLLDYDEAVLQHYIKLNDAAFDGYTETSPYTKGRLYDKIN